MSDKIKKLKVETRIRPEVKEGLQSVADKEYGGNVSLTLEKAIESLVEKNNGEKL